MHRGLLHKMKAYGITGNLIDWFSSYLKGRRQKVVIKNNSSAYCEISAGVPQGSVLSFFYYLYKWYCWQTCLNEQTICRWHFVRLLNSGYNSVENVIDHDLNEMDIW